MLGQLALMSITNGVTIRRIDAPIGSAFGRFRLVA